MNLNLTSRWSEIVPGGTLSWRGENRGVMLAVWYNVLLLVLSVAALPFDHRHILGLNPWVKPIKFEISVIVYLMTMAVLLSVVGRNATGGPARWTRTRRAIGWGIGVAMVVENSIIALQSLRGVRSHMNYTSLFNGLAFSVMGGFIAINTLLVSMVLGLYLVTRTGLPAVMMWGIRLGLLVLLAGSAEGALMVGHGAHTVGAGDGLAGLPFVNWSTGHGDLRVPHFFALHALQVFALMGWAFSRTRLREGMQVAVMFLFAAGYSAMVWALFAQAMAGRPLLGGG